MKIDTLVDRFVKAINQRGLTYHEVEELPEKLRYGPGKFGGYAWKIKKANDITWVDELEAKLPCRFPPSFRSLITRYTFAAFEVGSIRIFANTGERLYDEMGIAIFRDKHLFPTLYKNGYIEFAKPNDGANYDPVCFDTNRRTHSREYPIVTLDHEAMLCDGKPERVNTKG